MTLSTSLRSALVSAVLAMLLAAPPSARAESNDDKWQFSIMPYLWFPSIDGTIKYSGGGAAGSPTVDVEANPDDYLGDLDFAMFLAADARKGKWSVLTDFTYFKLSGDSSSVRAVDFNAGSGPVNPVSTTLNAGTSSTMESIIWTVAGGYSIVHKPSVSLDLIAGARYLALKVTTDWQLTATVVGPGPGEVFPASGTISEREDLWDAIVGVRGRVKLGDGNWFMPYYLDVGTGSSELTWQSQLGVGYAFGWGDLVLGYRHLAYEQDDNNKLIQDLKLSGFGLGGIFHF
jgi:hypothetical protein